MFEPTTQRRQSLTAKHITAGDPRNPRGPHDEAARIRGTARK